MTSALVLKRIKDPFLLSELIEDLSRNSRKQPRNKIIAESFEESSIIVEDVDAKVLED
jgi:hypothetical protein